MPPPHSSTEHLFSVTFPPGHGVIASGPRRRLVSFRLDDPDPMAWGGELVLRHGELSGQVTSAAWSGTLGACVGLAYVWRRDGAPVTTGDLTAGTYELNVGGDLHAASVGLRALFEASNERIRS